jgi:hypothetical protein
MAYRRQNLELHKHVIYKQVCSILHTTRSASGLEPGSPDDHTGWLGPCCLLGAQLAVLCHRRPLVCCEPHLHNLCCWIRRALLL